MGILRIILEIIGALSLLIGIILGIKQLLKSEKLTVTFTKFGVIPKRNKNGGFTNRKALQLVSTFKNCGNQQASILKIDFLYDYKIEGFGPSYNINDMFATPKVMSKSESYPVIFEEDIDFESIKKEHLHQKLWISVRITAISSKGIPVIRNYEIAEFTIGENASRNERKNLNQEIIIYNNKILRRRKENELLNLRSDFFF